MSFFRLLAWGLMWLGRVRVRFGNVLRLSARKTLNMGGRKRVWYASDGLVWVPLGAGCVDGFIWECVLDRNIGAFCKR